MMTTQKMRMCNRGLRVLEDCKKCVVEEISVVLENDQFIN